jgi:hypothetical protein
MSQLRPSPEGETAKILDATMEQPHEQEDAGTDDHADGEQESGDGNDAAGGDSEAGEIAAADTQGSAEGEHSQSGDAGDGTGHDTDESGGDGERQSGDGDHNIPDGTLEALAEKLEVDVKDLYETVVPMGEGESMTIGELKDLAADAGDIVTARAEIQLQRSENENSIMAAKSEIGQVVNMLGGAVTPQVLERAKGELAIMAERERRATIEAIPEWGDSDTHQRDRQAMATRMAEYGYTQADISHVHDHRLIKFIRDAVKDRETIRNALDSAKRIPRAPGKPGNAKDRDKNKAGKLAAALKQAKSGNVQAKTAAVSALINR